LTRTASEGKASRRAPHVETPVECIRLRLLAPPADLFRADDPALPGAALFVRVYDVRAETCPPDGTDLPAWFRDRVQRSYMLNSAPYRRNLGPVRVQVGLQEAKLERLAVIYPYLRAIEITAFVPMVAVDDGFLFDGTVVPLDWAPPGDADADPSNPNTLRWISDMSYLELTGRRVRVIHDREPEPGPYRTDATVFFFLAAETTTLPHESSVGHGHDRCYGRLGELAVHTDAPPTLLAEAADFAVVAAAATRARHLVGRLHRDVDRAVRNIDPDSPWHAMHMSAAVQREAIVMRSELTGRAGFFLGSFEMQRLYKAVSPTFGVPHDDLEAFDRALEDLQGFSTSLLGLAIDRSQMRFAVYGVLFALFSLAFASIAILDFVAAEPRESRTWVYVAVAAPMVAFGATMLAFSLRQGRLARRIGRGGAGSG
jgi:hypothetical protein